MAKLEVGIVLRVGPGAAPVVIGAVANDELLRHALRVAIDAAARRALAPPSIYRCRHKPGERKSVI